MSAKENKGDTDFLDNLRGKIFSHNGGWIMGKGIFCHGHDLMEELVGTASYFQLLILNATGRFPERRLADWLETVHMCMSWPDPRIWCNQIGALGGTMRTSVVASTLLGTLAADSRTYGPRTLVEGVDFIKKALSKYKSGIKVETIIDEECSRRGGKPSIMGFARPIAKGDERVVALERVAKDLGFSIGEHLDLAYKIEKALTDKFDETINIAGYVSAFLSDQGFSAEEACNVCTVTVNSGVTACYIDSLERPPETFLPMQCGDIDYQGPPPRPVPTPEP